MKTIIVKSINITEGQKEKIDVELSIKVNGMALVTIDDENYAVILKNGKGSVKVTGLTADEYTVDVLYDGNDIGVI